jgi:mannose-6-phosphate isomerase-like protein (cupin superfamily)
MAGSQEGVAGVHHLWCVRTARHEVHVALASYVERVTGRAAHGAIAEREIGPADGAAQQVHDVREHAGIVAYRGPMEILTFDALRNPNGSVEFQGAEFGGVGASFFVLDFERGRGPGLHTHDYAEICILLEGRATFHGPGGDVDVEAGHVVLVPAGEPHGFESSSDDPLRQVNIHVSPSMLSRWLEG